MERLKSSLVKHDFGIVGLSEVGVNWNRISHDDGWWNRTHQWFKGLRSSKSYNTTDATMGRAQAGGTITLARDRFAFCTDAMSFDPRNLGRWSSIRLQGKGGIRTRIVTVYCACPSSVHHMYSAYNQQLRHLARSNLHECPRKVFWDDLIATLSGWKEAGEQLVVMGDWNHPIHIVREKLSTIGLSDAIHLLHPDENAPATHNRGSQPIDGIFVSATLRAVAGGFCMFNKILLSDHRALWIDIPLVLLLGFEMPTIVTPKARRLKLADPRVLAKYYDYLVPYLARYNIYNRAAALLAITTFPLPPSLQEEYEAIHLICKKGMMEAEKQCRPLFNGVHPWSVVFAKARSMVVFWTIMVQKLLGTKVDTRKLSRLGKRLGLLHNPDLSVSAAYIEKDRAWDSLKETKGDSTDLRKSFIEALAQAQAEANNIPVASRLRALNTQEEQRRSSLAVRKVTNKLKSGSTSRVLTTSSTGEKIEITEKVPMEKAIIHEHQGKFHASEKYCPIMHGQLLADIGSLGFGPKVEQILAGTYTCPPNTPRGTRLFLKHMKKAQLASPPPADNLDSFRRRWKRTKEKTSSAGPLHFGHYKAGCAHDMLGWLLYTLAEIPFISGYSPRDWQQGIDVVILKSINDYRIEKMRTIVLYHPEFNMNNRRLGWEAMQVSINNNQLAVEQYSRPGRGAIDHVVNRQLSFNQFVYQRKPFGVCSCDLTGCYDRVVHSAISLAMQRLGFKPGAIRSQFETIQKLIHKVRTVFGDSDLSYGGTSWKGFFRQPPQGFGQGNTFGPPGWSILSSTIFAVLKDEGFGVAFCTALSKEIFELCGFAYVDDADLIQDGHAPFEVAQKLQSALRVWEEVTNATGGAMAPSKSWWYLIDFVWKNGSFTIADGGEMFDLIAHDENGTAVSLQYLTSSKATKMLGVWLAPDGNHRKQVEYMKKRASDWAEYIRSGHLSAADSWIALSTTIWKTLEYPLPALMLTDDDIRAITWPIMEIVLPRMGLSRNISKTIRYGPIASGGVGLRDLALTMGFSRLQYLLEHPWKKTPTGNLLQSNWESLTLEAGVFGSLLDFDYTLLDKWLLTSRTWVRATLQFAHSRKVTLCSSPFISFSPKRLRDTAIMPSLALVTESPAELKRLNQCRLFLRVITVADISNASGTAICGSLFGTSRSTPYRLFRRNRYSWPSQLVPPLRDWTLWRSRIKAAFCAKNWELRTRLGDWLTSKDDYYADWDYFIQIESINLFAYNGKTWARFPRMSVRQHSRTASFSYKGCSCDPPILSSLRRTTIISQSTHAFTVEYFNLLETPIIPWVSPVAPAAESKPRLLFFLRSCKEFDWLASEFHISKSISKLLQDWTDGNLVCVSDGSYNPDVGAGAAAWSIESMDGSEFITGGGRVAGLKASQSAYRSEIAGLLGISMALWSIEQTVSSQASPEHIVGCDGISALYHSITNKKEKLHTRDKHFDITSAVIGFWDAMKSKPFPVHVLGHQDDTVHIDSLPRLARMNVKMDSLAKSILSSSLASQDPHPTPSYTFGLPIISCHGVRIESCLTKEAADTIAHLELREYWIKKASISPATALLLNWRSFGRAFSSVSFGRQIFLRKWLSDTIPTGHALRKRKYGTDNRCPRCHCFDETSLHCLICHHRDTRLHRTALLTSLFNALEEMDTSPALVCALRSILSSWLANPRRFLLSSCDIPQVVASCVQSQDSIGWFQFLCGFHTTAFVRHQTAYFVNVNSRKSAPLWASKFTRALWNFIHEMWDHRNKAKYAINDLADDSPEVTALRSAALAELNQGISNMPAIYSRYFNISVTSLLDMSHTDLRIWFKTIRIFRESTSSSVVDVFSSQGPFRSWVGLGPVVQPPQAPPPSPTSTVSF